MNNMQMVGGTVRNHQVYWLSIKQSARAMGLLEQQLSANSRDPKQTQMVLRCCLLFVMANMLLERYESVWTHPRHGNQIIEDENPRIESSLVPVFRRLDLQSAVHGTGQRALRSPPPILPFQ
ncbi:hypothetical protein BJX66DRAFT_332080 [Aspergillus keveii]|uniref:Uncharacterized protein n=1 Tax=Aspergillus keveii TaxID=714993 RepID=A0ABR4GN61_9EURO